MNRIPDLSDWVREYGFGSDDDDDEFFKADEIRRNAVLVDDCDDEPEGGFWVGTTTYYMVLKDCVILGSDMEKGNHSCKKKQVCQKCYVLDKVSLPVGYTRSGFERDTEILMEIVDKSVSEGLTDVSQMADYIISHAPAKHGAHLLIGGYNKGDKGKTPHLFYISRMGVINVMSSNIPEIQGRFQTGSGKGAAFVIQNDRYLYKLSEKEGIPLLLDSIWNAIKNDKYTGIGIEYIVIRSDGTFEKKKHLIDELLSMGFS